MIYCSLYGDYTSIGSPINNVFENGGKKQWHSLVWKRYLGGLKVLGIL